MPQIEGIIQRLLKRSDRAMSANRIETVGNGFDQSMSHVRPEGFLCDLWRNGRPTFVASSPRDSNRIDVEHLRRDSRDR